MRIQSLPSDGCRGFSLLQMLVSASVGMVVIATLLSGAMVLRKSFSATDRYVTGINNESRLMDHVARDLRRALRVGMLVNGTNTPFKDYNDFVVTEDSILTINIPDYYASNTPDNAEGASYKTSRYSRARLEATYTGNVNAKLDGIVPYDEATTSVGSTCSDLMLPVCVTKS